MLKFGTILLLTVTLWQGAWPQSGDSSASIEEWNVPWDNTRPRDPFVAPDGMIWFVGQQGDYAATLNRETGEFIRYDLPDGAGPHSIIVDDWGRPWYTGNGDAHIGRIDPETGDITQFPTPTPQARDPHTMTWASDGAMWFSAQNGNSIGRLDTATGEVELLIPSEANSRPYGILTAPNGIIWVDLFGTNKLARVDPIERTLEEITLPRENARPRRIAVTSDGVIWYGDYSQGYLGSYNPETEEFKEWPMPSGGNSAPYAMAVDDVDQVWFVETGPEPNMMVSFDPETETFVSNEVPSGAGTIRHMVFDPVSRSIIFGSDAGTIGGAVVLAENPNSTEFKIITGEPYYFKGGSEYFQITFPHPLKEPAHSTIYSLSGRKLGDFEIPAYARDFKIPAATMQSGWYLLEIRVSGQKTRLVRVGG